MKKLSEIILKKQQDLIRYKDSKNLFLRFFYMFLKGIHNSIMFIFSKPYRLQRISYWKHEQDWHQFSSFTEAERYPELFKICQDYFQGNNAVQILSFGCSTGEEVFSIKKRLPQSEVIGVDINLWCLHQAKKKNQFEGVNFFHVADKEFLKMNGFDAIFALAVFQNPENRKGGNMIAEKYTFDKFEEAVLKLDRKLKVGGLLFLDNLDFNFSETTIANRYEPLDIEGSLVNNDRPLYNKFNQRVSEITLLPRVFKKLS